MFATCSCSDVVQRSCDCGWPKDDALGLAALKLLHVSSYTSLRRLRCEVTHGVVIVHGILPSYYLKQMAQTIIQRLEGIQSVMNLVEVREPDLCKCWDNEEEAACSKGSTSLTISSLKRVVRNPEPTTEHLHSLTARRISNEPGDSYP